MLDPWRFSADPKVTERMFHDLVNKVKLIGMLKRMKSERILTVTDSPYVNVTYGDVLKNMPADYNESILAAIDETFGTQVTKIGSKEVVEDPDIRRPLEPRQPGSERDRRTVDSQCGEDDQHDRVRGGSIGQGLSGDEAADEEVRGHGDGLPHPHADSQPAARGLCDAGPGHVGVPAAKTSLPSASRT